MELPSLRKAAEALQSARFIKRQYFTLRWTTGILDFPPFASQIIRPPTQPALTGPPKKAPSYLGLDTLLGTWQVHGSSLKKRGSRAAAAPFLSAPTAPKCTPRSEQTPRAPAGNPSLNYKAAFVLWHDNWGTLEPNAFYAR